jgi:hypothetical protein
VMIEEASKKIAIVIEAAEEDEAVAVEVPF